MVSILFIDDDKLLATPGTVRKLLDPACGTGGMLAEAQNYLREHHGAAKLYVYGQDYNKRAFATAASDMLMKQVDHNGAGNNVRYGDSFTEDQFAGETFDYFLTNPPFGVDWKKQQKEIQQERDKRGFDGRFGAGLPRVNDGSLLFLQHMVASSSPCARRSTSTARAWPSSSAARRCSPAARARARATSASGSSRTTGSRPSSPCRSRCSTTPASAPTSGSSPTARPSGARARSSSSMRASVWTAGGSEDNKRSLGDKRRHITNSQIAEIVRLYDRHADGETSRTFDNADFGYTRVTVERPLRLRYQMTLEDKARFLDACPHLLDDVQAIDKALGREPQRDWNAVWSRIEDLLHARKSRWKATEQKLFRSVFTQKDPEAEVVAKGGRDEGHEPDADLRDFENVPLKDDIDAYFEREVRPHVPDAWMDRAKDKVGYEINFNRHFYKYTPPRPLEAIDAELKQAEEEIMRLLREVTE
jgi:type I restriction enzyme M protein